MPILTLNQAAKASKRAKSTISKACSSGVLTHAKDDKGRCQIETSELFRVFPPKNNEVTLETPNGTQKTAVLEVIIQHLERELENLQKERERERTGLESQLEREKEQADYWRQQATNLLTRQPEPEPANQNTPEPEKRRNRAVNPWLWAALIVAVMIGGTVAYLRLYGLPSF